MKGGRPERSPGGSIGALLQQGELTLVQRKSARS